MIPTLKSYSPGNHKTTCPKCSADRKNSKDPCLSVAVGPTQLSDGSFLAAGEMVYNCKHCGWHGSTVKKKEWVKPQSELKNLSDKVIQWFAARGISNQTLLRYRVTESVEYMPQEQANVNTINFNYFLNGELVNIKFRDGKKNFKLVSGARLIPYGMDVCADNSDTSMVFVEGELDVLALYEAGIKNAISVPNGANKGSQKLDWLDDVIDFFEGKTILIATDMDEPGVSLRNELARRLGKENCYIVEWPEKDANDTLIKHGAEAVHQCIDNARAFPVEGIENITEADLLSLYDMGQPEGCKTGWGNIDEHISILPGMVTLVTGIPGHGKTTFLKNLLVRLSVGYGWRHMIYSGEEAGPVFAAADLMSIITGKSFFSGADRLTKDDIHELTPMINDHFRYYSIDENESTVESIMAKAKEMVKRFGINSIVIDNMSAIERGLKGSGDSRHNAIGDMMRDIRTFARNTGVHVFLVAHPKKMSKINGAYDVPGGYDIGDSSHYNNAPDYGLTVYRRGDQTEIHWWKVRFRYCGSTGTDHFSFNPHNSTYSQAQRLNDGSDKTKFIGQPIENFIPAGYFKKSV